MATADPDLVLLERFRASGDPDAFREIVQRYAGAVYATCHRILRDPGSAEDAAQETFFRLMTRPHRVSASVGGWLHRAATRLALDIRRSETSRRRREAEYETLQSLEATTWAEVVPKLDTALAALPEGQRDLLVRHFLRGQSQVELAAEANTSPATMSRRMKDAVDSLRDELVHRGQAIAPIVLFKLLSLNGVCGAPAGLKVALGKMTLYCQARALGATASRWESIWRAILGTPQAVYGARWAVAAAIFSILVAMLGARILQHVPLHPGTLSHPQIRADGENRAPAIETRLNSRS